MNSKLIQYLLYGLLAFFLIGAGYKACQIRKENAEKLKDKAEVETAIKDMGLKPDSTNGSAFVANSDTSKGKTTVSKDGIVTEGNTATGNQTTVTTPPPAKPATETKPEAQTKPTTTKPKTISKGGSIKGPGTGRYVVRAGTFTYIDGARQRLEQVIKAGYPNAEIGKINNGKYAVVIVYRSNNKAAAVKVADALEDKGIDAAVFDQNKK